MKKKKSKTALLIIDMINTLDFKDGNLLMKEAIPVAKNILKIKEGLKKKGIPVIYLNDFFMHWRSDWKKVYEHCTQEKFPGSKLSPILHPDSDDYFILKPKHSGFFNTYLDVLLEELGVEKLIMTGIAGNICVLFTANDAHMRGYKVHVPKNGIASNTKKDNHYALKQMKDVFGIETKPL
ncbi:MAG: isochorismatase family cysteine hydrolase [Bdellovibrionota bacterium]